MSTNDQRSQAGGTEELLVTAAVVARSRFEKEGVSMRSNQRRTILLVVTVAVSLLPIGVSSRLAASPTTGNVTTSTADLVSAKVAIAEPFDSAPEIVTYCFDQPVHHTVAATGFTLVDFNAANTVSSSSAVRTGEPKCVDASFASGIDVRQYSIAVVNQAAVKDERGFDAVKAGIPLDGSILTSKLGDSTAPQLLEVEVDLVRSTATYEFDEFLDSTINRQGGPVPLPVLGSNEPAPSNFSAWKGDGSAAPTATSVESINERKVTVAFPADALVGAVRFGVAEGSATASVADRQKTARGGQKNPPDAIGGATSRPDLARANLVPGTNQIDFDFDALVEQPVANQFFAFGQGGEKYTATRAAIVSDGRVRATFNDITNFTQRIVHVYVGGANAVRSSADTAISNLPGSAPIADSRAAPGFTSGPDLVFVSIDKAAQMVRFEFDEKLTKVASLAAADLARFKVVQEDGAVGAGQELLAWGDEYVTIGFRGSEEVDINNVVGATVDAAAVTGQQGKPNPIKTLADGFRVGIPSSVGVAGPIASPGSVVGEPTKLAASVTDSAVLKDESIPIVITVTDDVDSPIVDATVRLESEGVGGVSPSTVQTDVEGKASVTAESSAPGLQRIVVTVSECAEGRTCTAPIELRWVESSSELSCTIVGTLGDDILKGTKRKDVICGFGGDDALSGGARNDVLIGGAGDDILYGEAGADLLKGMGGADILFGGSGRDTLRGGRGNDHLDGGKARDLCAGGLDRHSYVNCEVIR